MSGLLHWSTSSDHKRLREGLIAISAVPASLAELRIAAADVYIVQKLNRMFHKASNFSSLVKNFEKKANDSSLSFEKVSVSTL